jgi:hypothetical protein
VASARPSFEPAERALRSLRRIRRAAEERGELKPTSFERARALIGHPDNHVRWQALIAVGNWIRSTPDAVWEVVLEHCRRRNKDMRMGVGVVLLEDLLGHDFHKYFRLVRQGIDARVPGLAESLLSCFAVGEAKAHWGKVRSLLNRERRRRQKGVPWTVPRVRS